MVADRDGHTDDAKTISLQLLLGKLPSMQRVNSVMTILRVIPLNKLTVIYLLFNFSMIN